MLIAMLFRLKELMFDKVRQRKNDEFSEMKMERKWQLRS